MRHWLKTCRDRHIAMVIGTTGLADPDHAAIDIAATEIPILQGAPGNMSLGVNLLFKIAGEVAKVLGDDYDIEIIEGHHRFKKDAPSGTAFGLAEAILKATGKSRDALVFDRHGDEATRKRGDVGMHALRIGDEIGRHTAYFAALGEPPRTYPRRHQPRHLRPRDFKAATWLSSGKSLAVTPCPICSASNNPSPAATN